mgnify:CR=1 FL=1
MSVIESKLSENKKYKPNKDFAAKANIQKDGQPNKQTKSQTDKHSNNQKKYTNNFFTVGEFLKNNPK